MVKRIVCAGTFDLLHTGHLSYLRKSKALFDNAELSVIVARDSNSERIKGKKTKNNEDIRLGQISALNFVDEAVLGFEGDRQLKE